MVPLAASRAGDALFANWDEIGSLLAVGDSLEDARAALVAALAGRLTLNPTPPPGIWAIAGEAQLPTQLSALPHWADGPVDPADAERARAMLDLLAAELRARRSVAGAPPGEALPELLLLVGELADVDDGDGGAILATLAREGPRHGIRVLAATARPGTPGAASPGAFDTWLMFRARDPADAARLSTPEACRLPPDRLLLPRRAGWQRHRYTRLGSEQFRRLAVDPGELAAFARATLLARDAARALAAAPTPDRAPAAGSGAVAGAVAGAEGPREEPGPALLIGCAGDFAVRHGQRTIAARWQGRPNTKAWELLALLAVLPPGPVDRGRLTEMLWPRPRRAAPGEGGEGARRDNRLYQALTDLRGLLGGQAGEAAGGAVVALGGGRYRLDERVASSQAHRFLDLRARAASLPLDEALDRYERDCRTWAIVAEGLLRDLDPPWLDEDYDGRGALSRRYREQALELTASLAARCLGEGRAERALALAARLARAEPADEGATCLLLACHGRLGDAGSLERAYQDHRAALRALYATADSRATFEPGRRVRELRATLLADLGRPLPASGKP